MNIECKHIIDASEPNEQGRYKYYYEYDLYYFREGDLTLVARSYRDTAERVSFLRMEEDNQNRFLTREDFALPFVKEAIQYLKAEGKVNLSRLTQVGGYVPLPNLS